MTGSRRKNTLPPQENPPFGSLPEGVLPGVARPTEAERSARQSARPAAPTSQSEKNASAAFAKGQKRTRVFGRGGIAMVRFTCRLPEERPPEDLPDGAAPQWENLLSRAKALAAEAETLCRTDLLSRTAAVYDADPDPRKRFRFKGTNVTLTCDATRKEEGVFEVLWHFDIENAGHSMTETDFREHLFAALSPPPQKRKKSPKKPGRDRGAAPDLP